MCQKRISNECARSGRQALGTNLLSPDRIETLPGPAAIAYRKRQRLNCGSRGFSAAGPGHNRLMSLWGYAVYGAQTGGCRTPGALEWDAAAGDRCSYVRLQLIFFNGAVEGLTAAFYAVLELSIPLRQLSNYMVWPRRSLPRWKALAEAHHVPGDEAMPGRFLFVQLSHCEAFSCVAAEARRCTPALRSPLACDWSRAELFLCSRAMFKSSSERLPSVSIPRRFSSVLASATS